MENLMVLVGSTIKIVCTITDDVGVPVTPTGVTVKVKNKNGIEEYPASLINNIGIGVFEMHYTTVVSGLHTFKWKSTGTFTGVGEMSLNVTDVIIEN